MKFKHSTIILALSFLTLLFITLYIIENYKVRLFKRQISSHKSELQNTDNLISKITLKIFPTIVKTKNTEFLELLIPYYEKSLSQITPENYLNAKKLPTENDNIKFCIIISSYNNKKYAAQNLNSIFKQNYHNWRMKYIDDASNDGMSELVKKIKKDSTLSDDKFLLEVHQDRKRSVAYNLYEGANNFCHDDEVMIMADGDDLLATNNSLEKLAEVYRDGKTWLTYGSFIQIPDGTSDNCCNHEVLEKDWLEIRTLPWSTSHLRTAYTWLFKKIDIEDLKYQGEFIHSASDIATMYPMLEMAGKERVTFIKDILYLYRMHPQNDHFIFSKEQKTIENYIKNNKKYKQIK